MPNLVVNFNSGVATRDSKVELITFRYTTASNKSKSPPKTLTARLVLQNPYSKLKPTQQQILNRWWILHNTLVWRLTAVLLRWVSATSNCVSVYSSQPNGCGRQLSRLIDEFYSELILLVRNCVCLLQFQSWWMFWADCILFKGGTRKLSNDSSHVCDSVTKTHPSQGRGDLLEQILQPPRVPCRRL